MECLFLILRKKELLDDIIEKIKAVDVHHGTIIDAKSISTALTNWSDVPMFGLLRNANNHEYNEEVKVLMLLLEKEQIEKVRKAIEEVIGDMNQPKTAVLFTLPISFAEGIID